MDRRRVFRVVAILVAVLAVATVAGGFTSAGGGDGDGERAEGFGFGEGSGAGIGDGDDVGFLPDDEATGFQIPEWIVTIPLFVIIWSATVFFVVFVVHTLWRGRLDELFAVVRKALVDFLAAAVFFLAMIAFLVGLGMLVGNGGGGALGGGAAAGSAAAGGASSVTVPSTSLISGIAVVLGLLGAIGAAVALGREAVDRDESSTTTSGGGGQTPAADGAVLTVPSHARDVDPSNEVYRAWIAMRDLLGEPVTKSETPGGVQRRASEAGLDGEAAAELTALFCVVRYGNGPVTEPRERRARQLLARLEASRR